MNDPAAGARSEAEEMRARIERRRAPGAFGRPLEVRARLTSTNDRAKELALAGAPEGAAVLALSQTRGRGQRGRAWISTPGRGLYLSVVLRPGTPARRSPELAVAAALATAEMLAAAGVPGIAVKAPNDVLAGGRKIAGALIEPRIARGRVEFAVAGIGLNLAHEAADWRGTGVEGRATSCRMEGVVLPLDEAAARLLEALERVYGEWRRGAAGALWARWTALGGAAPAGAAKLEE